MQYVHLYVPGSVSCGRNCGLRSLVECGCASITSLLEYKSKCWQCRRILFAKVIFTQVNNLWYIFHASFPTRLTRQYHVWCRINDASTVPTLDNRVGGFSENAFKLVVPGNSESCGYGFTITGPTGVCISFHYYGGKFPGNPARVVGFVGGMHSSKCHTIYHYLLLQLSVNSIPTFPQTWPCSGSTGLNHPTSNASLKIYPIVAWDQFYYRHMCGTSP